MSEGISFKKPAGFTPFFVAKLTQKKKLFWSYAILLFLIFGVNNTFLEADSDGVVASLTMICMCVAYILYARYLNKNPNIIEVSDKGIWFPVRRIFISKDRFYKAIKVQTILYTRAGKTDIQNVHIFFKASRKERRYLMWRLAFTKIKYKLSPAQYQVTLPILYTVGHGDDIQLDVPKTELIRVLNSLKCEP
ncbi:MAG: hypothetical protein COB14_07895 [Alphaproteobacteria bacterium]|nr:MAG: hypothetical protein COB14_07895 [Alphaproteobacteria bacterium]